jgi:hypothetical protein
MTKFRRALVRTRGIAALVDTVLFAILLIAWCRSCVVDETFARVHEYACWPNGVVTEIPINSHKPREWSLEGNPPLMHSWLQTLQSGYGRIEFSFGTGTYSYPTFHGFDSLEVPESRRPLLGPNSYTSDWTSLSSSRWLTPAPDVSGVPIVSDLHFLGLRYRRLFQKGARPFVGSIVTIPYWIPCVLTALPLALRRLRRKHREGHCTKCDYDLRASKDRCPECGRPIPVGA